MYIRIENFSINLFCSKILEKCHSQKLPNLGSEGPKLMIENRAGDCETENQLDGSSNGQTEAKFGPTMALIEVKFLNNS